MRYGDLDGFISSTLPKTIKGPLAMIFVEDLLEVDSTLRHHMDLGFHEIALFAPTELTLPRDLAEAVHRIDFHSARQRPVDLINRIIAAAPDIWMYYCFNAEYLFFPFCETRSAREMLSFTTEERRDSVLCYVIDLYAGDLVANESAVSLTEAYLDRSGYYAQSRLDPANHNHPLERQLDFFGGLRWRYEEHIPQRRRKIDRIALFRAQPGLHLRENHTFNIEEYNTFACPWHNNVTATICSFRTAKALKLNPGSTYDISDFRWRNSARFEWNSQQLMDLGLMEPGQWF
ncbi:hypothetical protein [Brevirhabdus sp.]|uniref:hypothetical protein n=1 Tax=Brevirhabdus sp. TaxID=2004514 RepID=UPI004059F354